MTSEAVPRVRQRMKLSVESKEPVELSGFAGVPVNE
jgi:hypothetical protein